MNIKTLAEQINEAVAKSRDKYLVSGLHEFRRKLGRNPRTTKKIFTKSTIFSSGGDNYAFHDGVRINRELQFNVGLEMRGQERWWRHGVAFSFEKSRTLGDPRELRGKVFRFNVWLRSNADELRGFHMWDWVGKKPNSKRSPDRQPGEIYEHLIEKEAFVFLGAIVPESEVNVDQIPRDFDRLYPLYQFVESGGNARVQSASNNLQLSESKTTTHTIASRAAAEIQVDLRHNRLQEILVNLLGMEFPGCPIHREYKVAEDGRVDVAVETVGGFLFCEIKVAPHFRAAVRLAIGQLLEYAHWPDKCRAKKWWVLSETDASVEDKAYIRSLRTQYGLPLFYRRIDTNAPSLGPEV